MKSLRILTFTAALCASSHLFGATATTIYRFTHKASIGYSPEASLVLGPNGVLYGTAESSVFSLTPPATAGAQWTATVLYYIPGGSESAPVTLGPKGEIYGVTPYGGSSTACDPSCGTVFMLTPPSAAGGSWTETTLYNFSGPKGQLPGSGLVVGGDGTLYGTTVGDGIAKNGTVYALTPPSGPSQAWTESVLYSFQGAPTDGSSPFGLLIGSGGTLYGFTPWGGSTACAGGGCGTVFSLTPPSAPGGAWTESVLYYFAGGSDTANPRGLVLGNDGAFYGPADGGANPRGARGTVFQLTPPSSPGGAWTQTMIYNLASGRGRAPSGNLAVGHDGALYGTTRLGGVRCGKRHKATCGTVFAVVPPASPDGTWTEKVLHAFTGQQDGSHPEGGVAIGANGALYGTTSEIPGTVFEVKP